MHERRWRHFGRYYGPYYGPYYGWINLVGLMLVYGSLCGNITYAYGVFLPSMAESFNWSRSALSGPYTLIFIVGGLLGPAAGMTIGRFGARRNIILFNLFAVIGLFGMSKVTAVWHLYIWFGLIIGVVIAFGEFIPITSVINNWFVRKRSLAMGLLFAAGGIGGFVMPPVIGGLIAAHGWQQAWAWLAGLHLVLAVAIGGLIIRNHPGDVGLEADGRYPHPEEHTPPAATETRIHPVEIGWTVREALRAPALWMIVALFSIILFATNILGTHQVAYLQDLGLMLGCSIIGRLLCGVLGMRREGRWLSAMFLASMGLGILCLMWARSIHLIYAYSILTGIGFGGMIVLMPQLLSHYFGRANYAHILGWTIPVVTLVSATGPVLAGALYDATGKYDIPLALTVAFIAAGIAISARMPARSDNHQKPKHLPAMP
jgi:MFS family permease